MPSPVGHALAGMAAGWLVAGVQASRTDLSLRPWRWPVLVQRQAARFATLGMLPDVDFLFGTHSTYTHSIGAALVVGLAVLALGRPPRVRTAVACAAAYGTHILLDWSGNDTTPPLGVMALWPFTDGFYQSSLHWFMAISRRYWLLNFWTHNLTAVAREIAILGSFLVAVLLVRLRRPTQG
jgi:membrane-bound metal-dependent hydrolase YbcI (DUF457 family)